jgi:hypothetical protein
MFALCALLHADEEMVAVAATFMKALVVVRALSKQSCAEGNLLVLHNVAYEMVCTDPQASVSALTGRVMSAADCVFRFSWALRCCAPHGGCTLPSCVAWL